MKKLIIFGLMLLLLLVPALAYNIDSVVNIISEYKINGVLTNASANISILYPSKIKAVDNDNMILISTGTFSYNYTCEIIGQHEAQTIFFNTSGIIGTDAGFFDCGDNDKLTFTSCPTGDKGYTGLWIIIIILIVLSVVGLIAHYPMITGICSFFLILMTLSLWGCGEVISYLSAVLGIVFLITALSFRHKE
jgi:hypothetical protein